LKWGTGGLNIDACRIPLEGGVKTGRTPVHCPNSWKNTNEKTGSFNDNWKKGRFPANLILDEAAAEMLDEQSGDRRGFSGGGGGKTGIFKTGKVLDNYQTYSDSGGASRFFYVAKTSKRERGEDNNHPTVKPQKLMQYLIKLVTPPNGVVLDPFMGSGSTGVSAKTLKVKFIGIEREKSYFKIAKKRCA